MSEVCRLSSVYMALRPNPQIGSRVGIYSSGTDGADLPSSHVQCSRHHLQSDAPDMSCACVSIPYLGETGKTVCFTPQNPPEYPLNLPGRQALILITLSRYLISFVRRISTVRSGISLDAMLSCLAGMSQQKAQAKRDITRPGHKPDILGHAGPDWPAQWNHGCNVERALYWRKLI